MVLLEVCTDSVAGVIASVQGGAQRIELCCALSEGGLSPSHGLIKEAIAVATPVPVHVMVRPRAGDFLYSEEELCTMEEDIRHSAQLGASGVVLGALSADGRVDEAATVRLVRLAAAQGLSVTFHRAFDMCSDLSSALEQLIRLGIPRVLSSGGCPTALQGADTLCALNTQAAGRIIVMAGAGVSADNVAALVASTRVSEVHGSARRRQASGMVYKRPGLSMSSASADEYDPLCTNADCVRAIVNALNERLTHKSC